MSVPTLYVYGTRDFALGPRAAELTANYVTDGEYFEWSSSDGEPARRLWLLNRLDSATSGVILVAASADLAAEIRAHFRRKT